MPVERSSTSLLCASFATLYLVWGSSYAVTKTMVTHLPPFLAGGARFSVAGVLLVLVAWVRGAPPPLAPREWRHFAVMGLLQVVLSAGLNMLAMRHVASSQSALLNASGALWIALFGAYGARGYPLHARSATGLGFGFVGVALLVWSRTGFSLAELGWQLVIIVACCSWALGTIYYRHVRTSTPMLMFVGLEMLIGGVALAASGLATGELPDFHLRGPSLAALGFLIVFSSCFAYTAFGYLMRHTTPSRLATYAYVNPAIAAVVGWAWLGERLTPVQLAGTAVILVGVVLVSLPDAGPAARDATPAEPPG